MGEICDLDVAIQLINTCLRRYSRKKMKRLDLYERHERTYIHLSNPLDNRSIDLTVPLTIIITRIFTATLSEYNRVPSAQLISHRWERLLLLCLRPHHLKNQGEYEEVTSKDAFQDHIRRTAIAESDELSRLHK